MAGDVKNLSIKSWSKSDRPREKLLLKGRNALTDAELLAILLRSGTNELSAVEVGKQLLDKVNGDLERLARLTTTQLMEEKGVGTAKALSIAAALELGRRRKSYAIRQSGIITSSKDVYNYFFKLLSDQDQEHFYALFLKRNNTVIKDFPVSIGGISGTYVDPRVIFKEALISLASSIILIHNHPSGNPNPSTADIKITNKIKEGAAFFDIQLTDHIIFTDKAYFSFADSGLI